MRDILPIIVNYRGNGFFYAIDGQHRLLAAKLIGKKNLLVCLSAGLSIEEEAEIFGSQGYGLRKPTPYEIFKANVIAKEPIDSRIYNICAAFNIQVKQSSAPNSLSCLSIARDIVGKKDGNGNYIVDEEGVNSFIEILNIIRKAGWEGKYENAYNKASIMSISKIMGLKENEDCKEVTAKKLINILSETNPRQLLILSSIKYPDVSDPAGKVMSLLFGIMHDLYTIDEIKNKIKEIA